MKDHGSLPDSASLESQDVLLAEAIDVITQELARGATVDPDSLYARYPQVADQLRDLLPIMAAVGEQSAASGGDPFVSLARSEPRPADPLPGVLGDFRILRELGRGGMGIVYEAEQISLQRRVAVKVLPYAALFKESQLRRFQNEARAAAMLKHPHIVSVHYVGCDRGVHYYAMELVEGQSLAEVISELRNADCGVRNEEQEPGDSRLTRSQRRRKQNCKLEIENSQLSIRNDHSPPTTHPSPTRHSALNTQPIAALTTEYTRHPRRYYRRVAEIGLQVAEALDYAHEQGVIHRDIKPSNVMTDGAGAAYVTDFGLAQIQASSEVTQSGQLVGTLRYMSPEQLTDPSLVDRRTDVYSLGVTLYELLARRPAFDEGERVPLVRQIQEWEPPPLRDVDAKVPLDLATIIERAMSKDRQYRYASAGAMAEDLRRFLEQKPILARPVGRLERAWRWYRRSPRLAALSAAVVALSLGLAALGVLFGAREMDQRQRAQQEARESRWQQYLSDMHAAMAAWEDANVGRVMTLLDRHRPQPGEPDHRGFEWYYLWKQCQPGLTTPTIDVGASVLSVAVSPGGQLLATGDTNRGVMLWDALERRLVNVLPGPQSTYVFEVAFSPDGQTVAGGDSYGVIRVWDVATGNVVHVLSGHEDQVTGIEFSPDGRYLASASNDSRAKLWDLSTGKEVATLAVDEQQVGPVAWADAQHVLTTSRNGIVRSWNALTSDPPQVLAKLPVRIGVGTLSHDRSRLALACGDGSVRLLDAHEGTPLDILVAHRLLVRRLAFSPDDQTLASASNDRQVILWDSATREPRDVLRGHSGSVNGLAFFPDGRHLASASQDGTVRFWDLARPQASAPVFRGHTYYVTDVAFDRTGHIVASASADGTVRLWNAATAETVHVLRGNTKWVASVAWSPRDSVVAASGWDGSVRLWDMVTGAPLWTAQAHTGTAFTVAFSPDGGRVASGGSDDGRVRVWDVRTGQELKTFVLPQPNIMDIAYSPDGTSLGVASGEGVATILDATSGRALRTIADTGASLNKIAYSPDGRLLATASSGNGLVRLLDAASGAELRTLTHGADVYGLAFSPDGKTLATTGTDSAVRLWDVATGEERAVLTGHTHETAGVAFSPDGNTLATGSSDRTIRLWRAASPQDAH